MGRMEMANVGGDGRSLWEEGRIFQHPFHATLCLLHITLSVQWISFPIFYAQQPHSLSWNSGFSLTRTGGCRPHCLLLYQSGTSSLSTPAHSYNPQNSFAFFILRHHQNVLLRYLGRLLEALRQTWSRLFPATTQSHTARCIFLTFLTACHLSALCLFPSCLPPLTYWRHTICLLHTRTWLPNLHPYLFPSTHTHTYLLLCPFKPTILHSHYVGMAVVLVTLCVSCLACHASPHSSLVLCTHSLRQTVLSSSSHRHLVALR